VSKGFITTYFIDLFVGVKMKPRLYFLVLVALFLATLACNLPWAPGVETPPPEPTVEITVVEPTPLPPTETLEPEPPPAIPTVEPTPESAACSQGMVPGTAFGVEFCYPEVYSNGFSQSLIPEFRPEGGDLPGMVSHPDMIEIILTGYPVSNVYHDPAVRIYPVQGYMALNPYIQNMVIELQALLNSGDLHPTGSIPFVPIFNAAQMMRAQIKYLDFQNGKGVRFITQYGQAAVPISNDSAFYAFIGLTDDGAYFLSATMPIAHLWFVDDVLIEPAEGWSAFSENFEIYIAEMEAGMLTQPADAFNPDLTHLDAMMESFLIPPGAIP
jgi:hypothetical protein